MNTFVILAVAATASTGFVAAWDNTVCPWTEYGKLAPLGGSKFLQPCQEASGWNMIPPSGEPNDEQRAKMCKTPQCFALMAEVKALQPSDCMLAFGDKQLHVKKLVDEFQGKCHN